MNREKAVDRVAEGLGFRPDLDAIIVERLKEAQRDLEQGKTLPRFLLQEDQPVTATANSPSTPLPEGFIRELDSEPLRYVSAAEGGGAQRLRREILVHAFDAFGSSSKSTPRVYVLRNERIDWYPVPNRDYLLIWSWYKADEVLTSNGTENQWLRHAADWIIGEAGHRLAMSLRDGEAVQLFDNLRTKGRMAVFADDVAREMSGRPYVLGAAN